MTTTPSTRRLAFAAAGALLTLPRLVHAQEATPAANVSGKEYILSRKSSFDAPANSPRNPFWPIGWVPTATQAVAAKVDVQADAFRVTTTSVDYPALAVINGRTYGVGEKVPVPGHPGAFVTVRRILDDVAVLDYQGHELRATNAAGNRAAATPAH
jgi:hypothetical protein